MTASPEILAAFEHWRLAELASQYADPCPDDVMADLVERSCAAISNLAALPARSADDIVLKLFPMLLFTHEPRLTQPPMLPVVERDSGTDYQTDTLAEAIVRDLAAVSPPVARTMAAERNPACIERAKFLAAGVAA